MANIDASRSSFERNLLAGDLEYRIASLPAVAEQGMAAVEQLPYSLKVLLENLLRHLDGRVVTLADIDALLQCGNGNWREHEIAFHPGRVLMQDFTGVPAVADLAALRGATARRGGDPARVNPACPVDLVIDHSVMVDHFGSSTALTENMALEMARNGERYRFLRWGQNAFDNFRVVPPGAGICHQINLEYLAQGVWSETRAGVRWAYPDTLVGTDSHTTMINGLGVLGWGVGGIEAEAVMLGQPISMLIPEVVGFYLQGALPEGTTATDLVLTITQMLRKQGVVGKFVEFHGAGLDRLPLTDRATIANMAPEYGATCGFFPVDGMTLDYLRLTGRPDQVIARVEAYCKAQGLWRDSALPEPHYQQRLELDLAKVEPSLAGPKRPQDRVYLGDVRRTFEAISVAKGLESAAASTGLKEGAVVIAAITSCTNTSNPSVMLGAGLLAKKAVELGLARKPWVKSSLAPGSKVVTDYLREAGLLPYLEQLGFNLVGYGCTTCIGNSGPLPEPIQMAIQQEDLTVCAVLSGNRNFEGRVHAQVKANWLASPPLVVAYAIAGTVKIDLTQEPIGQSASGTSIYLRDIWPTAVEIAAAMGAVHREFYLRDYAEIFTGDAAWQALDVLQEKTYQWSADSSYIQEPPFFGPTARAPIAIHGARLLAILGDSITTDHISPAGSIKADSPAGRYLLEQGVPAAEFNSYGSRRGNHQVMMRGTFANVRLRNEMVPGVEGGFTRHQPGGEQMSIYDAAMRYQAMDVPLVIIAGKEYGTGSSRDWAAKGTRLLGVKAVIAESFERIHRTNLVGMGILPLQFLPGMDRHQLGLSGSERVHIPFDLSQLQPGQRLIATVEDGKAGARKLKLICRIDTQNEVEYYRAGGILNYVLDSF